jgi:hypothetical protein
MAGLSALAQQDLTLSQLSVPATTAQPGAWTYAAGCWVADFRLRVRVGKCGR